jgi:GTP-binding protein HflX
LLLHVIDAANPEYHDNIEQVESVLQEIGAERMPVIRVYNKIDLLPRPAGFERGADGVIHSVWVSAQENTGLDLLRQAISEHFRRGRQRLELRVPLQAGRQRAQIHQRLDVLAEQVQDQAWRITVEADAAGAGWLRGLTGIEVQSAQETNSPESAVLARQRASP